ncbi:MAG: GAF domain-containing protein, partial [Polyangia bacterium]
PAQQARALLYLGGHVGAWRAPLAQGVPILRRAYVCSLESGDLEFAAYALSNLVSMRMLQGEPLDRVLADAGSALAFDRVHHPSGVASVLPFAQAARCLKGLTRGTCYDDDAFDETAFLGEKPQIGPVLLRVLKVQTSFLLGERERAVEWAQDAPRWLPALRNLPQQVELHFYAALALADDRDQRATMLEHLQRLGVWAESSPDNYRHKRDLVRAELARVDGQAADALALYQCAIEEAGRSGFVQDEALAHELCARFHAARGAERMANVHLSAAADGYSRWGATAKVALLYAEFPALALGARRSGVTTAPAQQPLDYLSLIKVTEALTDELELDRLVEKLVRICTEAAHAERGVLVLEERGPVVRATATASGEVTLDRTPLGAARSFPISIVEQVLRGHELILLGDAAREGRFTGDAYVAEHQVRSVLAVPICRKGRTLGVLYFENNLATGAFEAERGEMFKLLSVELAIALENSRLFAARKRSEAALRLVADASARLAETLDYDRVIATVGAVAVPALADWCIVEAYQDGALQPVAATHVDPSRAPALEELRSKFPADADSPLRGSVLRSGRPLLVVKVTEEGIRSWARDQESLRLVQALQPRSVMVVPLLVCGRSIGVATFGSSQPTKRYDRADLALAQELMGRIARAVENASLHRDLEQALHQREERDQYLRLIFRTLPGAMWAFDRDLRFTHASGRFFGARYGAAKMLLGSTLYDFLGTRDPTDRSLAHHLDALTGKRQSFEYRYRGRWYAVQLEPLRDGGQQILGCVGVAFDVTDKRAAAERLAKSEARLSAAQAIAHIGSFEWNVEPNTLSWTDELLRIYGLSPEQFAGTFDAFLALVHPDDLEATKSAIFDAYRSVRPFSFDHRIVRADGQTRVLHTRGDVVRGEDGKPVRMRGTCWDVTELTEANRERERTLSLLGATIEATADGILAVDRQGGVYVCNSRFVDLWRIPSNVAARREESALVEVMREQLEDPDQLVRGIRERHAQPDAESIDILRFRDGRVFERYCRPQRIGGAVVGTVWSFRDISERERLLRRALFLADASRLLVSLDAEQALDAVAHMAVPFLGDGCAIDLFGDGGPRRLVAISRDVNRPILLELHPGVLGGNSTIYQVGTVSHLGVPLMMKGRLAGAITVCAPLHRKYGQNDLDLVEELGRRASLAVENARLYRKSQEALRSRDEFLAVAAHEIRGPASSIHLAVQSLEQAVLPPEALPKLLKIVEQEDRRLAQFVNELLDVGRMRGGLRLDYQDVDLTAVIQEATTRLGPDLRRSGSSLELTAQRSVVGQWDKFRLDQVVTNLVGNAIKFGLGNPIEISVRTEDDWAVVAVTDHGIGIERAARERIFQPFERGVSLRHYGGLGLGLHIVKTVVEAMGGTIDVESEPR